MRILFPLALLVALVIGTSNALLSQRPVKVYISADMEGVAGVVTADQLAPGGFEYERFRGFMTSEVLAAIEGAREGGATQIVVSDSHGSGQNLLIERFPDDVMIVRSTPRPLMMMQGIDSSFAAAIFVGYHASTTNPNGVRAHTMSSADFTSVSLNGTSMPEAGFNAAIAGYFGVPVVMITGDDFAVNETKQLLGNIEGAVVKYALGFHSAETMTPAAAQKLIRETARRAVMKRSEVKPYIVTSPVRLDLTFKNYLQAEITSYLPNVERTTAHAIRFDGRDIVEISRLLEFLLNYQPGLRP